MSEAENQPEAMSVEELREILLLIGKNLSREVGIPYCDICDQYFISNYSFQRHQSTSKHEKASQRMDMALDIAEQSGRYQSFEEILGANRNLPLRSPFAKAEREATSDKANAVLNEILDYWRVNNSAAITKKSVPPISL